MKFEFFTSKLKKIYQVGPRVCARIVVNRTMIRRFAQEHKQAALAKKAATTWDAFTKMHPNFILNNGLIFLDTLAQMSQDDIIAQAHKITKNKWHIFNQDFLCDDDARWHTDYILKQEPGIDYTFDPETYFDDIRINIGQHAQRTKDIRVVWELSRLHLLMPLGKAYALTHDVHFADYFQHMITDWQTRNPYLLGVNWMCPMEVGIRALNLIVGYSYFKDAEINQTFWQSYVCLLYDHMRYLEGTWEYYDGRTSNHYLSDLVGYFYLTDFFQDLNGMQKKRGWVVKEILAECEKQVFEEGMSYEGSTAYHGLVTELFHLFALLCEQKNIALPISFHQKLARMFDAVAACTVNERERICIGDNDSGKVLWPGLPDSVVQAMRTQRGQDRYDYPEFGLSIIKDGTWHVSLRHHAYYSKQPSGHFHNDVGSVTLALDGIPILVDPGSFCYTASAYWRNYFRSASVHNAISVKGKEPVAFDEKLFALNLPGNSPLIKENINKTHISHSLYENEQLKFTRQVEVQKNAVFITDILSRLSAEHESSILIFNFTFAPEIELKKEGAGWLILVESRPICLFESDLNFESAIGWVSHNYGSRMPTVCLKAEVLFTGDATYESRFKRCGEF